MINFYFSFVSYKINKFVIKSNYSLFYQTVNTYSIRYEVFGYDLSGYLEPYKTVLHYQRINVDKHRVKVKVTNYNINIKFIFISYS